MKDITLFIANGGRVCMLPAQYSVRQETLANIASQFEKGLFNHMVIYINVYKQYNAVNTSFYFKYTTPLMSYVFKPFMSISSMDKPAV
jgi:hypothetical protein